MKATAKLDRVMNTALAMPAIEAEASASRAPAVNRAAAILRVLASAPSPMTINGIARELSLVPSTCFHVLNALEDEGFVNVDSVNKRYTIGLGLVILARSSLNNGIPARILKHEIDGLASRFDATCIATQLTRDDRMVIIAVSHGSSPFGIHFDIGRRFPAYVSATGRCFAAHSKLPKSALKAKFEELVWGDPPKFEDWFTEVEDARRDGVGVDRGTYVRGYIIIAVPVFEGERMTRSLVAIAVKDQLTDAQLKELKKCMCEAGQRVSH